MALATLVTVEVAVVPAQRVTSRRVACARAQMAPQLEREKATKKRRRRRRRSAVVARPATAVSARKTSRDENEPFLASRRAISVVASHVAADPAAGRALRRSVPDQEREMGVGWITPRSARNLTDLADGAVAVRAHGRQTRQNVWNDAPVRPSSEHPAIPCAARSRCRRRARNRARLSVYLVLVAFASNSAAPASRVRSSGRSVQS